MHAADTTVGIRLREERIKEKRFYQRWLWPSLVFICLALLFCMPFLAPYDPNKIDLLFSHTSPSMQHPLGTDGVGRDIMSRLMVATPLSLLIPLLVVALSLVGGILFASINVSKNDLFRTITNRASDLIMSFPSMLIAILVVAVFGKGIIPIAVSLGIAYTPYVFRVLRPEMERIVNSEFVRGAFLQGQPRWQTTLKHVLPNVLPVLWAQATVCFGYALIDVAALSFLGLGLQPPRADWGNMLASGLTSVLQGSPWESLFSGILIFIVILSVVLLGDWLELKQTEKGQLS